MRIGCLLPLVSAALIIGGGQSVYTALSNRKPTEVTLDSILTGKPNAKWLRITGGTLDTADSSYVSGLGGGDAKNLYVPLIPQGSASGDTPIHVLVQTKDPELLAFANQLKEFDENKSLESEAEEFLIKNLSRLKVARTIEGVVKFGIDSGGKEERKIRKLYDNLAGDAIIIEEGAKPSAGMGFAMLGGGLLLGGFIFMGAGKKTPPAQSGGTPPPLPQS